MTLVCTVLVVGTHAPFVHDVGTFAWWIRHFFTSIFGGIAVPYFFIVSGFMLAAHVVEPGWYGREMKKRIWSLLIPYLIWTLLMGLHMVPISALSNLIAHRPIGFCVQLPSIRWMIGWNFIQGPALGPFWYIRWLMCLCLMSPLIFFALKKWRIASLFTFFIMAALIMSQVTYTTERVLTPVERLLFFGTSPWGFFYFSVGMAIRMGIVRRPAPGFIFKVIIGMGAFAFCLISIIQPYCHIELPYLIRLLRVPCLVYGIWLVMPSVQLPMWLTGSSFLMYATHMFIYKDFKIVCRAAMTEEAYMCTVLVLALITPIFLGVLLHRHFPGIARLLMGGR